MIDCAGLSERMPEVAHGVDQWSAEEHAHLLNCGDCRNEWRIVAQGVALGRHHTTNIEEQTERLLARLRSESSSKVISVSASRKPAWRWGVPALVAMAASVALVVWLPQRSADTGAGEGEIVAEATLFPELLQLTDPELEEVLNTWSGSENQALTTPAPTLGDLSDEQLKLLLRQMEEGI